MKYDFDKITDRKKTNSYKWDTIEEDDIIPLWVADMDFKTAPCIIEALKNRVEHGIFGYTKVPDEYFQATIKWFEKRHGLKIEKDEIIYTSGVVPAISAVIKALTEPGDNVIVQTPVYNCFFSSIRNNDCQILENKLIYRNNSYHIDFEDFERKASDPKSKIFLLCNPHNPTGRVWSQEELLRLGEICLHHDVIVVSDEIHCEIVYSPFKFTPFASINESFHKHSVTCCSPSKAFNIAGLQIANIFAQDESIRRKIDRAININEVCDVNPFGVIALTEAYENGYEWLCDMKEYVYDNYKYVAKRISNELPDLNLVELQGTYLAWLDCSILNISSAQIADHLLKKYYVYVNSGEMYRDPSDRFIRINLATSREILAKGVDRIIKGLSNLKNEKL